MDLIMWAQLKPHNISAILTTWIIIIFSRSHPFQLIWIDEMQKQVFSENCTKIKKDGGIRQPYIEM